MNRINAIEFATINRGIAVKPLATKSRKVKRGGSASAPPINPTTRPAASSDDGQGKRVGLSSNAWLDAQASDVIARIVRLTADAPANVQQRASDRPSVVDQEIARRVLEHFAPIAA